MQGKAGREDELSVDSSLETSPETAHLLKKRGDVCLFLAQRNEGFLHQGKVGVLERLVLATEGRIL